MFTGNISINAVDALQSVNLLSITLSFVQSLYYCNRTVCGTISMIHLLTKQINAAKLAKRSACGCTGRLSAVNVCESVRGDIVCHRQIKEIY